MSVSRINHKENVEGADFGRDLVFEEAFGTSEGFEFMESIYRLLAQEMLLMGRDGTVVSIPRESSLVMAKPQLTQDRFPRQPMVLKGTNGSDLIGLPILYEADVFAMLILNEPVLPLEKQQVPIKLKPVLEMIEWYIQVIHQRRMICELHARTETSNYNNLFREQARSLESADKYRKISNTLKHAHLDTIYRLSITAEYKDANTADHIKRMSIYSKMLAEKMGLKTDEVEMMLCASPMHDIGKMGVPDAVLLKPGPLNPEERRMIEQHPVFGANILGGSESELLEYAKVIALTHHERWDGTGYPQKLKGKDIPLAGRIVAVADVFDAMTTNRSYRPAWSFDDAVEKILRNDDLHFDPEIVDCFLSSSHEIRIIFDNYKDITPSCYGAGSRAK